MSEVPSSEELFTSAEFFGVETATTLQRAICCVADGLPLGAYASSPIVKRAFGSLDIEGKPSEMAILAGTRAAKTRLAAAFAVRAALTCPVDDLQPGEVPRVPIVSLTRDLAGAAFSQIVGTFMDRPRLKAMLVGEPRGDAIQIRHPSGRVCEIAVAAGKRAGASLVARWFPAVIFDEAPRMLGSDDGAVVNLSDMLAAIRSRMRGPVILIGSPWAPQGPVYDLVQAYWGKPSARLVVVRAKGSWMNPYWWTPQRIASLRDSDRAEDRLAFRTDHEAEFVDPEEGLVSSVEIDRATMTENVIPPEPGYTYVAAMDPATRGNAWTLVVRTQLGPIARVVLVREWRGTKGEPLDPEQVLREVAETLEPYHVKIVTTDQWSFDALSILAHKHGLALNEYRITGEDRTRLFLELSHQFAAGTVQIPHVPVLRNDLLAVRKRATAAGMSIILPIQPNGRHCDSAMALALCLRQHCPDKKRSPQDRTEDSEIWAEAAKRYIQPTRKWYEKKPWE